MAAVLTSGGLLSACAGGADGGEVTQQGAQQITQQAAAPEQGLAGSDYDRPLQNSQQPSTNAVQPTGTDDDQEVDGEPGRPPGKGSGKGRCKELCSGGGECADECADLCEGAPPTCDNVVRTVASCAAQGAGPCDLRFNACVLQNAIAVSACSPQ